MKKGILWIGLALTLTMCQTPTNLENIDDETLEVRLGTSQPGGSAGMVPQPVVPPAAPPSVGDLTCDWYDEGATYRGTCENSFDHPITLYVFTYIIDGGRQYLHDVDSKIIESGRRGTAEARWPTCDDVEECFLRAQGDGSADHAPPPIYNYPDKIKGHITGSGLVKDLGTCDCPKPCVEKTCVDGFEWIGDPVCDCVCIERKCKEGFTWNGDICDCVCTTECKEPFSLNVDICECECDPETYSCPEGFHRHLDDCQCYCDPIGEPECPEQTWDERTCSWVGPCPCDIVVTKECIEYHGPSNPKTECGFLGLVPIGKVEAPGPLGTCVGAHMDAYAAIVKGANFYHIYPAVTVGDRLCTCDNPTRPTAQCVIDWSHVTYCGCPE